MAREQIELAVQDNRLMIRGTPPATSRERRRATITRSNAATARSCARSEFADPVEQEASPPICATAC